PDIMKKFQVDRGAIKFVLSGANIMCPGLTSPGGALNEEVLEETPVAIMAEGKQHALAIGYTKLSAKDIPPGYWYADRPLPGGTVKIDRRRSISAVSGRLREKKGIRKSGKEEEEKKKEEDLLSARRPRLRAILFQREETERLPARGERSR
ncbi:hypothetical protein GW17_00026146, partial [Ensete ventricosum]